MEKLTLLITGASGFVGSALSTHFASRYRVIALPREWTTLPEVDGIINLSGAPINQNWSSSAKREIVSSRVGTTQKLVHQLLQKKKLPHFFLSASAIGYYGDRGEEALTEGSGPGFGFLPSVCTEWESASLPLEQQGIRRVLTRFGVVIGPGGIFQKLLPLARLHLAGRLGSGDQWMSWISIHDLAHAIDFIIQHPDLRGPINCTSPQPVRQKEFASALAQALRVPGQLPVPAYLIRLFLKDMGKELLLSSTKALPQKLLSADFHFQEADIAAALHKAALTLK